MEYNIVKCCSCKTWIILQETEENQGIFEILGHEKCQVEEIALMV